MAKMTAVLFTMLLLAGLLLPGCSKDRVLDVYGDLVAAAGNIGLDSSMTLKGERKFGKDKYTGTYLADYVNFSGQECPFGGTMLERREEEHVTVTCTVEQKSGQAELVWNCGADKPVVIADGPGTFTETVYLAPGSNYFDLNFTDFSGSVELEISPAAWH